MCKVTALLSQGAKSFIGVPFGLIYRLYGKTEAARPEENAAGFFFLCSQIIIPIRQVHDQH